MRTKKRVSLAFIITMLTLFCFMGSILTPYAHAEEFIDDSVATSESQTTEEKEEKSFWDSFLGFIGLNDTSKLTFKVEVANQEIESGGTVQVHAGDSITVKGFLDNYKNATDSVGSLSVEYPQDSTGVYTITDEKTIVSDGEIADSSNMFVYCPIKDTSTSELEIDPCPVIPKGTTDDTDLFSFKLNVDQNIAVNSFSIKLKNITIGDANDAFVTGADGTVYNCSTGDEGTPTSNDDAVIVNFNVTTDNIPVTDLKIVEEEIFPAYNQKTVQLTAKVIPENATNKNITWESNKDTVAIVDGNGLVSAGTDGYGEAIITAKTEDGNKTDTCKANVSFARITGKSLKLDSTLDINYRVKITCPQGYEANDIAIKCWRKDKDSNYTFITNQGELTNNSNVFLFPYEGILSTEMGEVICTQLYVNTDNDNIFETPMGGVDEYSILQYAKNMLGKETTTENLKSVLVSLLNYGSSAQLVFNVNKDNLVNSVLTSSQREIPIVSDSELEVYASEELTNPRGENYNYFSITGNSLELRNIIYLKFIIVPAAGHSISEGKFKYKIADADENSYKTADIQHDSSSGKYYAKIALTAPALVDMYEGFIIDQDGNQVSQTKKYGAFSYCKNMLKKENSSDSLKQICLSIIDYGKKSKAYFQNITN